MRRRWQAWQYLFIVFAVFWALFATVLIVAQFPFFVVSIALTTIMGLSGLVILLAWAYQNNK